MRLVIVDEARGDARRFVPWSHVAKVLDLLWGHDVRTVDLPGLGLDFELIPPEALHNDPFVYPDDPIASPLGWLLAAVAAVLAFVLTFAGAWRSRRVRPRRSRAS